MARYGNVSASSLMSAARAANNRQMELQDQIAGYEWDLSEKSRDDLAKYLSHLNSRAQHYNTSDPSKALSYQKQVTSAQRSFASSEIGRATTQVLYGNIGNRDKYNTLTNLWQQAISNGDENLAQRIEQQAARLSMTIQNEEMAKAGSGGGGGGGSGKESAAVKKGYDAEIKSTKSAINKLDAAYNRGAISQADYTRNKTKMISGTSDKPGLVELYQAAKSDPRLSESDQLGYENDYNSVSKNDGTNKLFAQAQQFNQGAIPAIRYLNLDGSFSEKTPSTTKTMPGAEFLGQQAIANQYDINSVLKKDDKLEAGFVGRTAETDSITGLPVYRNDNGDIVSKGAPGAKLSTSFTPGSGVGRNQELVGVQSIDEGNGIRSRTLYSPITGKPLTYYQNTGDSKLFNENRLYPGYDAKGNPLMPITAGKGNRTEWQASDFGATPWDQFAAGLDKATGYSLTSAAQWAENNIPSPGGPLTSVSNAVNDFIRDPRATAQKAINSMKTSVGNIFNNKAKHDLGQQINGFSNELGKGNYLGAFGSFMSNPMGILQNLAKTRDQLSAQVAAKREAERQAEIKRQQEFAAQQRAIQEANVRAVAHQKSIQQKNWQNVALPYAQTPQGKKDAAVIGSTTFNQKYLGSPFGQSLYNKYL